ncbi:AcrR family transcriptional regulator [Mycolicibacterium sp. BK556]|uniref:TetR family transcriptional regulator n=1 Tax=Mycobacteriaceae TaxID=1762 RepID=UPI0017F7136B|nr:TetR family transcriptional regulator [Mycobacterium sp. BK086]MBB3606540.1 AcrR family transcriptional regulator [Mycolicibacterium sp. BK556]MBB3636214.1 AcrR family transcriptional regulator [Mycolicibacterium sp. BK607]MBB3753506.1 AcrR family transcriptional regulator [Mycolicibacterium sp. BK634]
MLTSSQGAIQQDPAGSGLRSRKKHKTLVAIQDAALELFAEHGFETTTVEQIAERAEVSTATFFRYFRTKSDVVFGGESDERVDWLPALKRGIIDRPPSEDDVTAVKHAILDKWVSLLEPTRVRGQYLAAETSPLLHGLSSVIAVKWQATIRDALAERHGLAAPDQRCRIAAAMMLGTFSETVSEWVHNDNGTDLAAAIDGGFALMSELCAGWFVASPPPSA